MDNRPGKERFERLTNDNYSQDYSCRSAVRGGRVPRAIEVAFAVPYWYISVPRLLIFSSIKKNGKNTPVYSTRHFGSDTRVKADSRLLLLPRLPLGCIEDGEGPA